MPWLASRFSSRSALVRLIMHVSGETAPSVHVHSRMTAILRAISAPASFLATMRLANRVPHALSGDERCAPC